MNYSLDSISVHNHKTQKHLKLKPRLHKNNLKHYLLIQFALSQASHSASTPLLNIQQIYSPLFGLIWAFNSTLGCFPDSSSPTRGRFNPFFALLAGIASVHTSVALPGCGWALSGASNSSFTSPSTKKALNRPLSSRKQLEKPELVS